MTTLAKLPPALHVTSGARAFVRKAAVVFDVVRGEALTVARSLSLIMEVAGHWKSQV